MQTEAKKLFDRLKSDSLCGIWLDGDCWKVLKAFGMADNTAKFRSNELLGYYNKKVDVNELADDMKWLQRKIYG